MKQKRASVTLAILVALAGCRGVAGLDELTFNGEATAASSATSGGAASSGATTGGGVCQPGTQEACAYSGPPETAGIGACRVPVQICDDNGASFGPCGGEVLPQKEDCATPAIDESCDGRPACDGKALWALPFGESANVALCGVAVDSAGNVVLAGDFKNTINFGGADVPGTPDRILFVAKLDSEGKHVFSRGIGGAKNQYCSGMDVDAMGNILLGGYYTGGSTNLGDGQLPWEGDAQNGFYGKLNALGEAQWSEAVVDGDSQSVRGIAAVAQGDIFMVGRFQGQIKIGPYTLSNESVSDTFIAKMASDGSVLFADSYTASWYLYGNEIAAKDKHGAIFAGQIGGTANFGGTSLTGVLADNDSFAARIDENGDVMWAMLLGGNGAQEVTSVAMDDAGNALIAGVFEGTVNFGGAMLQSMGGLDGYLIKVDPTKKVLWAKAFGGAAEQRVEAVSVDGAGNILIAGTFENGVTLGDKVFTSNGGRDAFVAKLNPGTGDTFWAKALGSINDQSATTITGDMSGNTFVSGRYSGEIDLGDGVGLLQADQGDAFVAKLAP
jgi:hypothetical protein